MEYSKDGLHLTEQFESCELLSYQDQHGIWTIGWGHTGPEVRPHTMISQQQADQWLQDDIQKAAMAVNTMVKAPLTQNEFDALTDFTFNVGIGAFHGSTLLTLLNNEQYENAANQFDHWDHCGGKEVAGLLRRRVAETALFRQGMQS